jgi:hypothetical protein
VTSAADTRRRLAAFPRPDDLRIPIAIRDIPEGLLFATEHNAPTFPEKAELSAEFCPLTARQRKKSGEGSFPDAWTGSSAKNRRPHDRSGPWCAAER